MGHLISLVHVNSKEDGMSVWRRTCERNVTITLGIESSGICYIRPELATTQVKSVSSALYELAPERLTQASSYWFRHF